MHIVQIIPILTEGGAERFLVDLSNELSKTEQVSVVTLFDVDNDKMFLPKELSERVNLYTLGKRSGFDVVTLWRVAKILRRIKPDVVHAHLNALEYSYLSLLLPHRFKMFHTIHSDALLDCPSDRQRRVRQFFYKKMRVHPITISNESQRSFRSVYKCSEDFLIFNGRNELKTSDKFSMVAADFDNIYRKTRQTKVFVCVANISVVKNQLAIAQAVETLVREGQDICMVLIGRVKTGDEDILEKVQQICPERIHCVGVKDNVADYLLLADYFCLCSVIEGMPITIIEALSAGRVCICSPVGGIRSMITDGVSGILSSGTDVSDIVVALKRGLGLSCEEKSMVSQKARSVYENLFSIKICSQKHLKVYNSELL